jgi:hypothetical protein
MNRTIVMVLLCALFTVGHTSLSQSKKSVVHGEIVELTSYVKEGIKPTSVAGREIALANIGNGGAFAMLEKGTNKLYIIAAGPNDTTYLARVKGYLGTKAFVGGPVATRSGIRVITVEEIGKSLK